MKAPQKPQEEKDTQCQEQEQRVREVGRQVASQVGDKRLAASLRGTQKEPACESRAGLPPPKLRSRQAKLLQAGAWV